MGIGHFSEEQATKGISLLLRGFSHRVLIRRRLGGLRCGGEELRPTCRIRSTIEDGSTLRGCVAAQAAPSFRRRGRHDSLLDSCSKT